MKNKQKLSLLVVAALIASVGCKSMKQPEAQKTTTTGMMEGGAEYMVTLTSTWTPQTHPLEYPEAGALTGPHLSGMIGASHNEGYAIFKEGMMPTPGLEKLSEEGKHSPLDEEIKAAMTAGTAGMLFESDPLRDFTKSVSTKVTVSDKFPMVSVVAMIAPSPDWFTGTMVNLKEGGAWVPSKTVSLVAWDSGGDDGATYKADDLDTNPKKPTMMTTTPHFVVNGVQLPVGTITFTKM